MNLFILTIIIGVIGFSGEESKRFHLNSDTIKYCAVKYSVPVDYSLSQEIMGYSDPSPDRLHKIVAAYHYYIQYGRDTFISILDPGIGNEFMGIAIKKWDYVNGKTEFIHYMDFLRKYSIHIDTINYSIQESRGLITNLCNELPHNLICDSVSIVSYSGDAAYTVCFNGTIPNLAFNSLFYPDIKYLPTRIFGIGCSNATMTLEEVIYGKASVDSLLQLFTFENYSLITDEDRDQISEQEVNDLIEKYDRLTKH